MRRLIHALALILAPFTALAGGLDGTWAGDGGQQVVVSGNSYAYYIGGRLDDGGNLAYNDSQIRTQSTYTGAVTDYFYRFSNGYLHLQDPTGRITRYAKARPQTGGDSDCSPEHRQACFEARYGSITPDVDPNAY